MCWSICWILRAFKQKIMHSNEGHGKLLDSFFLPPSHTHTLTHRNIRAHTQAQGTSVHVFQGFLSYLYLPQEELQ